MLTSQRTVSQYRVGYAVLTNIPKVSVLTITTNNKKIYCSLEHNLL